MKTPGNRTDLIDLLQSQEYQYGVSSEEPFDVESIDVALREFFLNDIKKEQAGNEQLYSILANPSLIESTSEFKSLHPIRLLLDAWTQHQAGHNFLQARINNGITGLTELIELNKDSAHDTDHFDFASELLSVKQVEALVPARSSSKLPLDRLQRIRSCLELLEEGKEIFNESGNGIFISTSVLEKTEPSDLFESTHATQCEDHTCRSAYAHATTSFELFIKVMGAVKIAELELGQKYDAALHDPYFHRFDHTYLSTEDLNLFPPVLAIVNKSDLARSIDGFISIITGTASVKVMVLNSITDLEQGDNGVLRNNKIDLASLAISQRNTYVYNAPYTSASIWESIDKGLRHQGPALWNLLIDKLPDSIFWTASASRVFPSIEFNPTSTDHTTNQILLKDNFQSNELYPVIDLTISKVDGKHTNQYSITPADFLASIPENQKEIFKLPKGVHSVALIPIAEYLELPQCEVANKYPYILLCDDFLELRKAVVPLAWIQFCRRCADQWQYWQEVSGVKSSLRSIALERLGEELESKRQHDLEALRSTLLEEFSQTRKQDLTNAIDTMLNNLLDPGKAKAAASHETEETTPEKITSPIAECEPVQHNKQPIESEQSIISSDVWIESEECTSCNDCIDALPAVFKYNDEKQAVVHNPQGASFAKIVAAAEKCPAMCIHPGMPYDPDEPGLNKLIERAKKFN